jgi:hypothetical protein
MEFDEFHSQLTNVMSKYRKVYPYYQESENRFLMPAEPERLPEFEALLNIKLPKDFVSFYSKCAGLLLPDVYNSIFLDPIASLIESINRCDIPVFMEDNPPFRVVPFGSDAAGNMFAIIPDKANGIYYLQGEFICPKDGVLMYLHDVFEPKRVADTFSEFLDAVLEDARAYLEQRPGWKYLDDGLYGA